MALVTIQRSPSPSTVPESISSDAVDGELTVASSEDSNLRSPSRSKRSKAALKRLRKLFTTIRVVQKLRFSENYLAVKGAALILPQSECARRSIRVTSGGDIERHLQLMIYLLRPQDTIKVAVKLESAFPSLSRYLAVVACTGRQDTEESIILGIDIEDDKATIGMLLPIWGATSIHLDGDGGFMVTSNGKVHIFKPVSVQAMWSAIQCLNKMVQIALRNCYFANGLTHTWTSYYQVRLNSIQRYINEWHMMDDLHSKRTDRDVLIAELNAEALQEAIRAKLKEIMMQVDLEEVTCKYLRTRLEEEMGMSLNQYKTFIDEEMLSILGQMDSSSEIFDYLYLGSEWNASNLEELKKNDVGYILNITREIDNFFPGDFEYYNLRLWDKETTELMKHWDKTYKFIKRAKHSGRKILVHCKMGMSRSAATVIAFAMKEYGWSLDKTMAHVKKRRSVVRPNQGFLNQLVTYQGILDASKQRNNLLWRSPSVSNLSRRLSLMSIDEDRDTLAPLCLDFGHGHDLKHCRPRSWSPTDGASELLYKARQLASDADTSEDDDVHSEQHASTSGMTIPSTSAFEPVKSNTFIDLDVSNVSLGASALDPTYANVEFHPRLDPTTDLAFKFDEYEVSSRSADSLDIDEAFLDTYTPDEHLEAMLENNPVVLLNYFPQEFNTGSVLMLSDDKGSSCNEVVGTLLSDTSDYEEFDPKTHRITKPSRGMYDISMLTGFIPESVRETILAQGNKALSGKSQASQALNDSYDVLDEDLITLHPDMKLELAIAEYRKRCRIARFIKMHQHTKEELKENGAQLIQAETVAGKKNKRKRTKKVLPQKVRKDDFWIKMEEEGEEDDSSGTSPNSQMTDEAEGYISSAVMQLEGVCATDSNTEDVVNTSNKVKSSSPAQLEFKPIHPATSSDIISANFSEAQPIASENSETSQPISIPSPKETQMYDNNSQLFSKSAEAASKEIGIWQHYEKEAIPWSPGTVKRTKSELEQKYSVSEGSEASSTLKLFSVPPSSNIDDTAEVETPKVVNVTGTTKSQRSGLSLDLKKKALESTRKQNSGSVSFSTTPDSVFSSPMTANKEIDDFASKESTVDQSSATINLEKDEVATNDSQTGVSDNKESSDTSDKRETTSVSSIYEREDIPEAHNRIREVKQLFEERERSSSYGDIKDADKNIQRSSSLKQKQRPDSERYDRKSPRRITVLPIIRNVSQQYDALVKEGAKKESKKTNTPKQEPEVVNIDLGEGQGQAKTSQDVKVIKIGLEPVELIEGKVKKHQQEYETYSATSQQTSPSRTCKATAPKSHSAKPHPSHANTTKKSSKNSSKPSEKKKEMEKSGKATERKKENDKSKCSDTQLEKRRTQSHELVPPTVERILSKSPTLARKLRSQEIIACHSPEENHNKSHSSQSNKKPSKAHSMTSTEKVAVVQSASKSTKTKLEPVLSPAHHPTSADAKTADLDAPSVNKDETAKSGLAIYDEEGISWSKGTVKKQLHAKFESMGIHAEPPAQSLFPTVPDKIMRVDSEKKLEELQSDQSKSALHSPPSKSRDIKDVSSRELRHQDKSCALTNKSTAEHDNNSGKSRYDSDSKKTKKNISKPILLIERDTKKTSISRARSLGSHKDLQSMQSLQKPSNEIGRSSSFKNMNEPTSHAKHAEPYEPHKPKQPKSQNYKDPVKTSIASHKPTAGKKVVIIPKVDNSQQITKKHSDKAHQSNQTHLLPSDQSKWPNKEDQANIPGTMKSTNYGIPQKPSCDKKNIQKESIDKENNAKDSDGDSTEDISVKDLCGIFEAKDRSIPSTDSSPAHSNSDNQDVTAQQAAIPKTCETDQNISKSPKQEKESAGTKMATGSSVLKSPFNAEGVKKRKVRCLQGKSHPLSKLISNDETIRRGPTYSTM